MRKKILFVDDGPKAVRFLWTALHGQSQVWDMTFACNGAEALGALVTTSFDVIVSNLQLPDLPGGELLSDVKRNSPHTIRVLMCSPDRWQEAMQVTAAQQFLAMPCVSETFENLITRTCLLHDLLREQTVRDAVGRIGSLPALPRVYQELTALMQDVDAGAEDVAEIMRQDMGMTAKVLQIVNSSFFGLSNRVTDVRQAVAYLGFRMIKDLVLTAHLFGHGPDSAETAESLQEHACRVASVAARLVRGKQAREDAYTAGILHDAGRLVVNARLPLEMKEMERLAEDTKRPSHLVEQEELGTSHAEIGGYLLMNWGLPMPIVEAVTHHHSPSRIESCEFGIAAAIHVAECLTGRWEWERGLRSAQQVSVVDLELLQATGVADQLETWEETAREICSRSEPASV